MTTHIDQTHDPAHETWKWTLVADGALVAAAMIVMWYYA